MASVSVGTGLLQSPEGHHRRDPYEGKTGYRYTGCGGGGRADPAAGEAFIVQALGVTAKE